MPDVYTLPAMKIHSLNISNGGVPKHAIERCEVSAGGLAGDRQRDGRHHGGPERAVSLYSLELIAALRAEGRLYARVLRGGTLGVGDEVLLQPAKAAA